MRTTLKTTTAVLACLNLAVPYPAIAQTGDATGASSVCATDPDSQECRDAVAQELSAQEGQEGDASEVQPADGAEGQDQETEQFAVPEPDQDADPAAGGEQGSAEDDTAGAGASEESVAAEEPMASEAPQEGAEAGAPAGADTLEADAEADIGVPADEPVTNGASQVEGEDAETGAGAADAEAPGPEAVPDAGGLDPEDPEAAGAGDDPQADATPPADLGEDQTRAAQPATETGEPAGEDVIDAAEPGTAAASGDGSAAGDASTETAGSQATQQDEQPAARDEAASPQQSADDTQGADSLAAAAAGEGDVEAEDVATETVTEESARSSAEDFESDIDQSPEVASGGGDDDGLSKLEKALLLGAGALAVGTVLRNGREIVAASDDRVVVSGSDGGYELIKDDNALLRRPGSEVRTETYDDGSTRTVVSRADGSQIVTIRDPQLRVVRRVRVMPDGQQVVLIDDTGEVQPVDRSALQAPAAETRTYSQSMDQEALRRALAANQAFERSYSLNQVRSIEQVREQVPAIDLENITFATGSAAIPPEQADELTQLGRYIASRIEENPREIFLVEGHTDAVGDAAYNLALSDRRAESVALALTEYFGVAPENLVVQGYGEQFLKVQTDAAEQANRRASIRRITPLLQVAASQ